MAEFLYNNVQTIAPGEDAIVNLSIGCNRGNYNYGCGCGA